MEIIIPLPQSSSINTYKELMGYLKQFELAIHHAQKAVENAEEAGLEIKEDTFVEFIHPALKSSTELEARDDKNYPTKAEKDILGNFYDNHWEELQSIELRINLAQE